MPLYPDVHTVRDKTLVRNPLNSRVQNTKKQCNSNTTKIKYGRNNKRANKSPWH